MRQSDIEEFITNNITGKTSAAIAEKIYNDGTGTPAGGFVTHFNNAVLGPDVKDDIVKLSLLISAIMQQAVSETGESAADAADAAAEAVSACYRGQLPNGSLNDVAVNSLYMISTGGNYTELPEDGFTGLLYTIGSGVKVQYAFKFETGAYWYRRYAAGNWYGWCRPEYPAELTVTPYYRGQLPSGSLNDVTANTLYLLATGSTYTELPEDGFEGILYTIGSGGIRVQYAFKFNTGALWYRRKTAGTWYGWRRPEQQDLHDNGKMFVKGNSIMVGSVHTYKASDGKVKFDHLSDWGNSPYSVVAKRLNVSENGVNSNILLSSTGFMYRATDWIAAEGKPTGSFLDNIIGGTFTQNGETVTKAPVDLSDYDYLMLHFFKDDLNKIPIGDENSTAVTDEALADYDAALTAGTLKLAGGVIRLVQYLNENYPHCRLILVGAPPVDTDIVPGGNPFSKTYTGSGVSQTSAQLDTLMHTLAEREKFVYIDWQEMKLSYYYQRYTGATVEGTKINNVHANNDNTYRQMGEYLAEHI